jgi:hypothetical protein
LNFLFILFKILWLLPPGLYLFKKIFLFCKYLLGTILLKMIIRLILKKFGHEIIFNILFFYLDNFPPVFRAIRILNICLWLFSLSIHIHFKIILSAIASIDTILTALFFTIFTFFYVFIQIFIEHDSHYFFNIFKVYISLFILFQLLTLIFFFPLSYFIHFLELSLSIICEPTSYLFPR